MADYYKGGRVVSDDKEQNQQAPQQPQPSYYKAGALTQSAAPTGTVYKAGTLVPDKTPMQPTPQAPQPYYKAGGVVGKPIEQPSYIDAFTDKIAEKGQNLQKLFNGASLPQLPTAQNVAQQSAAQQLPASAVPKQQASAQNKPFSYEADGISVKATGKGPAQIYDGSPIRQVGGYQGGFPILNRTASSVGGSTPQERFAIQQQEIAQEQAAAAQQQQAPDLRQNLLNVLNAPTSADIGGRLAQVAQKRDALSTLNQLNAQDRVGAINRDNALQYNLGNVRLAQQRELEERRFNAAQEQQEYERNKNKYQLDPNTGDLVAVEGPAAEKKAKLDSFYSRRESDPRYKQLLEAAGDDEGAREKADSQYMRYLQEYHPETSEGAQ